jgi:cytochrome b561
MSQPNGYSRLQIRLHWIIFGLLVLQFVFHEWIADAWDSYLDGDTVVFHPHPKAMRQRSNCSPSRFISRFMWC